VTAQHQAKADESSATNPLRRLHDVGQAVWLDFLARRFIAEGGLKKLVEQDGLTGVTSNPSIFEKAIAGSADYDSSLDDVETQGDDSVMALYERLAIEDIQRAADALRPVYEATERRDGYVSLEVSPYLAMDTEATIAEARRLWQAVGRDNLMIKVPGTKPGLPAIRRPGEGSPADRLPRFGAGFRRGSVDDRGCDRGGGSSGRAGGGVVRARLSAMRLGFGGHLEGKERIDAESEPRESQGCSATRHAAE
jgi:Transaldolase/Fructose-6-phosphate aldolase